MFGLINFVSEKVIIKTRELLVEKLFSCKN